MAIGSTIKTVFGFLATLVTRYTPIDLSRKSLEGIFNYLPISDSIITAGQPTERQFELVKEAGFLKVINLAPHNARTRCPMKRQLSHHWVWTTPIYRLIFRIPLKRTLRNFVLPWKR